MEKRDAKEVLKAPVDPPNCEPHVVGCRPNPSIYRPCRPLAPCAMASISFASITTTSIACSPQTPHLRAQNTMLIFLKCRLFFELPHRSPPNSAWGTAAKPCHKSDAGS